jgi:outer membrane protein assembly factor BamD
MIGEDVSTGTSQLSVLMHLDGYFSTENLTLSWVGIYDSYLRSRKGGISMKFKSSVAWLLSVSWIAGCSSLSMPSLPWKSAPKSDPTAEALFEEGNRNFSEKRYVRALDNYSKLRSDHPFSPLMTEVELKIADAYYRNQQYPEAINAFKEFQSMHPANENIPFVVLRLGQAHFDQFTSADRDQKNTEIAKGYFESVISNYPKSPQAAEARQKLASAVEYLAEHDFNIAFFYYQQEKFPAARDRFEEIVRKYKDTPTAIKSLFYLGESYRSEKNSLKATLAYEAVIQHYPQSKFAADARTQLAQVEKEKHDPLALLLMRDRRPATGSGPEVQADPSLAKLRDLNLVAKTEVVNEKPGDEKGFLRRVADKINPFAPSDNGKKEEPQDDGMIEALAKRNQAAKNEESSGLLASLWPFGSKNAKTGEASAGAKPSGLVSQIDESLKQKGIDADTRQSALKPPPTELPNTDDLAKPRPPTMDTSALLSSIDGNLKKSGKDTAELPPPPEAAQAFKDIAATQAVAAKPKPSSSQDVQTSGILSSIDQKLKSSGVEPGNFQPPPSAAEIKGAAATQKPQARNVEIEPKVTLEKGPLYLSPAELPSQEAPAAVAPSKTPDELDRTNELPSRILVKGPVQPQAGAGSTAPAIKKPASTSGDEPKGALDQIRQDIDSASKVLNPFNW